MLVKVIVAALCQTCASMKLGVIENAVIQIGFGRGKSSGFKSRRVRDTNNKAPLKGGAFLFALASPRGFEPLSPP